MLHRISILALFSFAAALVLTVPVNADTISEKDVDVAPHYWHDVHIGLNLKLNAGRFETFDRKSFHGEHFEHNSKHGLREFWSGVPNTAEWIWWLNHSDKDKKEFGTDPVVTAPEPASLFLLGAGILALGGCRRRANHSAPNS